jgi:catechol 2,3-dioxygenase-like lactoylglutathione lyase family enzyme
VLGRFLEYSLATPDIRASLDFYGKLGFSQAEVGETWLASLRGRDGRQNLSRSAPRRDAGAALTFVKPDLLKHAEALETHWEWNSSFAASATMYSTKSAGSIPAASWSGSSRRALFRRASGSDTNTSKCGYFLEIALPTPSPEAAKAYWEQFGFVGIDETDDPACRMYPAPATISISVFMTPRTCAARPCDSKSMMSAGPWRAWRRSGFCRPERSRGHCGVCPRRS